MEIIDFDELYKQNESPEKVNKQEGEMNKNIWFTELLHFVIAIVAIIFSAFFIVTFIGQRTQVNGSSMETTLSDGDNLIVDKLTYRFRDPKRFEIVVFPHDVPGQELYYIKRVIGLPGEEIQIADGVIYVNGTPLEENYGIEEMRDAKLAASPVRLGEDEYFVLGDNRNHSSDSREIGAVSRETIIGRAVFRIWPFKKLGKLK